MNQIRTRTCLQLGQPLDLSNKTYEQGLFEDQAFLSFTKSYVHQIQNYER